MLTRCQQRTLSPPLESRGLKHVTLRRCLRKLMLEVGNLFTQRLSGMFKEASAIVPGFSVDTCYTSKGKIIKIEKSQRR